MADLDYLYSPSKFSKSDPSTVVDIHIDTLRKMTQSSREQLKCELGITVNESGQTVDIYYPTSDINDDTCVLVYIHGGYWQELSLDESGFLAGPLVSQNIIVAVIGYDLAPKANMSIIVEQCRLGCAFIAKKFPNKRLFVSGHSAGGHLTALMLSTDWSEYGLNKCPFKGGILLSGVYNLAPIQKCYVNEPLNLTDNDVTMYSPLSETCSVQLSQHLPNNFPCLIAEGELESPEFKRQREEYVKVLTAKGLKIINVSVLPNEDHFTILERLSEESYDLTKMIIHFIHQVT